MPNNKPETDACGAGGVMMTEGAGSDEEGGAWAEVTLLSLGFFVQTETSCVCWGQREEKGGEKQGEVSSGGEKNTELE